MGAYMPVTYKAVQIQSSNGSYSRKNDRDLSQDEINNAKEGEFDYQAFEDETNIGICEAQGRRGYQEDAVAYGKVEGFDQLPDKEKQKVLQATFAAMQTKCGRNDKVGSTAITTIIEKDKITTAHVGDSTAHLVIFDKNGEFKRFKRLNKQLHKPDPSNGEHERIKKVARQKKGTPPDASSGAWRLGGRFGTTLTRAIGDTDLEISGLSHEPEIEQTVYDILPDDKGFVIVACDGLTERMTEDQLEELIKNNQHLTPDGLAKKLVEEAINPGKNQSPSGDNVSVMVTSLNEVDTPKVMAVFDGHSSACGKGREVSEALSKQFNPMLDKQLKTTLKKVMADRKREFKVELDALKELLDCKKDEIAKDQYQQAKAIHEHLESIYKNSDSNELVLYKKVAMQTKGLIENYSNEALDQYQTLIQEVMSAKPQAQNQQPGIGRRILGNLMIGLGAICFVTGFVAAFVSAIPTLGGGAAVGGAIAGLGSLLMILGAAVRFAKPQQSKQPSLSDKMGMFAKNRPQNLPSSDTENKIDETQQKPHKPRKQ